VAINDGDTHNSPVEQIEAKFPLLVERYALRQDSGGAGEHRGGLGTEQVVQARAQIRFHAQIDRVKCRPWGLYGGLAGFGNSVAIHRFGEPEQQFDNGKAFNLVLEPGDAYIKRSGGGGGFGSPLDREAALVAADVAQGYISKDKAEQHYGLAFNGSATPDPKATAARRIEMRAKGLPIDDPVPPEHIAGAAGRNHSHHHEHENMSDEERLVIALSGRCCS
jgi:N-methylhydantoinase B